MHRPEETELQVGLAAPDRLAPSRCTMRPTARQRRRSDTRIAYGGEVSFQSLRHLRSERTSMNSLVTFPKSRKLQGHLLAHRVDVRWLCPLWVISGHMQCKTPCPLYPRKRHQMRHSGMSALGQ